MLCKWESGCFVIFYLKKISDKEVRLMGNVQDIGLKVQFLGIQLYQYFVIYVHKVTTATGYKKVTTTQ